MITTLRDVSIHILIYFSLTKKNREEINSFLKESKKKKS